MSYVSTIEKTRRFEVFDDRKNLQKEVSSCPFSFFLRTFECDCVLTIFVDDFRNAPHHTIIPWYNIKRTNKPITENQS